MQFLTAPSRSVESSLYDVLIGRATVADAVVKTAVPLLDVRQTLRWAPLALALVGAGLLLNLPRHWASSRQGRAEHHEHQDADDQRPEDLPQQRG